MLLALALPIAGGPGVSTALAAEAALPSPKRVAPPEVPPVVVGNLRIEALQWGRDRGLEQDGGYIVAYDRKSGAEQWTLRIYQTVYEPKLERDVQDVFLASMRATKGGGLAITDEKGRRYDVNLRTRTVVRR